MTILEPTTTITDLILSAMSFYFGHMLFRVYAKKDDRNVLDTKYNQFWGITFFFLGAASFLGALAHGFPHLKGEYTLIARAWPFTVMCMGIVSFYVLLTLAMEYFPRWRNFIFIFAYFKMMVFFLLMFGYPKKYFGNYQNVSFKLVILDYAPVLAMVLVMNFIDAMKSEKDSVRAKAAKIMSLGIFISIAGTLVQMSGFSLHKNFNHNDLYHVIQMLALFLMYKAIILKRIHQ